MSVFIPLLNQTRILIFTEILNDILIYIFVLFSLTFVHFDLEEMYKRSKLMTLSVSSHLLVFGLMPYFVSILNDDISKYAQVYVGSHNFRCVSVIILMHGTPPDDHGTILIVSESKDICDKGDITHCQFQPSFVELKAS